MEPLTAEERERLNQIPHLLKGCNCGNCEVARKAIALCDEAARLQGWIKQMRTWLKAQPRDYSYALAELDRLAGREQ